MKKMDVALFAIIASFTVGLSQVGSYLVNANLAQHQSVQVFSFLHFTHVRNMGGIFGIMQGKGWVFATLSFLVLAVLVTYICMARNIRRYEYICYGLIVGGGASNILDRFIYGSVVDFIDVRGISFWHYIFNTADVMIHLGIWPLVLISLLWHQKEENGGKEGERPAAG
ncbi:signal peptidase II [Sulfidibacter corallicola]|uniref:Lipoprotein signal peptidase n=1 Tax=Sulfidibacter corallicola TaxID=2818388 RepID=A0A8A4TZR7_SULCO|nr:signal peptidase II [Sulfidibacter corallicola]QTD51995.1 signal peptidase II [Sulfidibacter corallicola]